MKKKSALLLMLLMGKTPLLSVHDQNKEVIIEIRPSENDFQARYLENCKKAQVDFENMDEEIWKSTIAAWEKLRTLSVLNSLFFTKKN